MVKLIVQVGHNYKAETLPTRPITLHSLKMEMVCRPWLQICVIETYHYQVEPKR